MECEFAGEVFVDNRIELQIQAQPVHNVDNFPQNIPVFFHMWRTFNHHASEGYPQFSHRL
jgi:hypothetical protein